MSAMIPMDCCDYNGHRQGWQFRQAGRQGRRLLAALDFFFPGAPAELAVPAPFTSAPQDSGSICAAARSQSSLCSFPSTQQQPQGVPRRPWSATYLRLKQEALAALHRDGDQDALCHLGLLLRITYEDLGLLPETQRIANGGTSPILSSHPISEFVTRLLAGVVSHRVP